VTDRCKGQRRSASNYWGCFKTLFLRAPYHSQSEFTVLRVIDQRFGRISVFSRTAAIASLAAVLTVTSSAPLLAQDFGFSFWDKPSPSKIGAPKPKTVRRQAPTQINATGRPAAKTQQPVETTDKPDKTGVVLTEGPASHPLVIVVSIRRQRITVYDGDKIVAHAPISSGSIGKPTPLGVYSILEKQKVHFSNLYDAAPMPNMQRITWSGVAMHAGILPGYPASHGCIRLPSSFSKKLYEMTKTGQRVIVAREDAPVKSFAHAALFESAPIETAVKPTNQKVADASVTRTATSMSSGTGLISSAAAETPPNTLIAGSPRVSKYRQDWLVEMAKRAQAVTDTATALDAAKIDLTEKSRAAAASRDIAKATRSEAQRLSVAARKAEADRIDAEKTLDQFASGMLTEKRLTDEGVASAAFREEELDAIITKKTEASRFAAEEATDAATAVRTVNVELEAAESALKTAQNRLTKADQAVKTAKVSDEAAKRREAKRKYTVAVFISRQTQKLYVRQGQEPILESPITIKDPGKVMGTHVFTALSVAANQKDMTWSVVTVPTPGKTDKLQKPGKGEVAVTQPVDMSGQNPTAALDRITIPQEVRDQIADVMKPGSSLIVSDFTVSNETGPFTDIIVPLR
jgi:lipoprotein-anchoring transpeptidase ErfK/SrfK